MVKKSETIRLTPAERYYSERDYVLPPKLLQDFKDAVAVLAVDWFGAVPGSPATTPVRVIVEDCTRDDTTHYFSVPYGRRCRTARAKRERLDALLHNATEALAALKSGLADMEAERNNKKRKGKA